MSTNSGLRGHCDVCGHANNGHNTAPCPAKGCSNRWKRCQITGGCFRLSTNWTYRMCYGCKDHPAVKGDLDFGGKQKDVTKKQKQDYQDTSNGGGDTSSGEVTGSSPYLGGSSPWRRILLPSIWRMSFLHHKCYSLTVSLIVFAGLNQKIYLRGISYSEQLADIGPSVGWLCWNILGILRTALRPII